MLESLEDNVTPVNVVLIAVIIFLVYKLFFSSSGSNQPNQEDEEEELPPMAERDFTLMELAEFDGIQQKRILMAVNGKVFDVSPRRSMYGPGGSYRVFAGRDASRGLATFSVESSAVKDEYDDLSDLNSMQMDSLREWEMQFLERYKVVGKLLTPEEAAQREEERNEKKDQDEESSKKDQ